MDPNDQETYRPDTVYLITCRKIREWVTFYNIRNSMGSEE